MHVPTDEGIRAKPRQPPMAKRTERVERRKCEVELFVHFIMFTLEGNEFAGVNVYHDESILCGIYSSKTYCRISCCCRLTAIAKSLQGSFSLDEFEAIVIENVAAVPNLDPNTTCSCRGHWLGTIGRNYCPCRSVNSLCSRACHGDDMDENNEKIFSRNDWLTKTQIRNFFSGLAASRRKQQWANSATSIDEDVNDDLELLESIEEQNENEEIFQEVVDEISLKHPIVYDVYNLCEYYANAKLAKFNMQMLVL